MKKKIMLVATGLSTSLILVSAIPGNVNQFWNVVGIEKVHASDNIETLIPDSTLREAISEELIKEKIINKVEDLTMKIIESKNTWDRITVDSTRNSDNRSIDITGLSYVSNINRLYLNGYIENLSVLHDIPNIKSLYIGNIHTANFDEFADFNSSGVVDPSFQTIVKDRILVTDNKIEIDLDEYIGKHEKVSIKNVKTFLTQNGSKNEIEDVFNVNTNKITINNLDERLINTDDVIDGKLVVEFDENAWFKGTDREVPIIITQPFVIYMPVVRVKDVTMYVGDTWNNDMGLVKAQNKLGETFKANELDVEGEVDTNKIGENKVTYSLREDSNVSDTAIVKVEKRPTGGGGTNSKIEDIKPTNIMTDKKSLDVYNVSGKKLEPKTLTKQTTDFVTEKINTIGKVQYYRIGENEWVKTDDVKVFHYNNAVKQTHGDDHKELTQFRNIGQVSNRALKPITNWVTDRYAYFKDEKYHRVATHEWVHDDHVVKYTSISGVVKVNEDVPLYNSQGKASNRGLMNNSEFITDKSAMINDQLMYRVATDEWVPAESVTLK